MRNLSWSRRSTGIAAALLSILAVQTAPAQNVAAGTARFRQTCAMCHAVAPGQKNPMGPNLSGVVGRKAGTTDFRYSEAMKNSGLVWDEATLEKYLAAPTVVVPGTSMAIAGPDAAQRADIIAYLKTLQP